MIKLVSKFGSVGQSLYFCTSIPCDIVMKNSFRIWALMVMMALMSATSIAATQHETVPYPDIPQGELTSNSESTPFTHDGCQMLSAPAQIPAVTPSQNSRLLTPLKYRTTLMRTNMLRRSVNRLLDNIYAPLSSTGQFTVERLTTPLREPRAVNYYVITLCRLLC